MIVNGRNILETYLSIRATRAKEYIIRIDDKRIPEFWMEIVITQTELDKVFLNEEMQGEGALGEHVIILREKNETDTSEPSDPSSINSD